MHPHVFFESLAYVVAICLLLVLRRRRGDELSDDVRWWVICAAIVGGALGCRLLAWLQNSSQPTFVGGKTIVGGLAGGLLVVELVKRRLHIHTATGDLFVFPLILGIAIGRVGCFLTGLADDTSGVATDLPWGIDFGDGVARHPTQLYEILFLFTFAVMLLFFAHRPHLRGDVFKLFMIGYMAWRFLIDFLKPGARIVELTAIQLACFAVLVYYAPHLVRIARTARSRAAVARN